MLLTLLAFLKSFSHSVPRLFTWFPFIGISFCEALNFDIKINFDFVDLFLLFFVASCSLCHSNKLIEQKSHSYRIWHHSTQCDYLTHSSQWQCQKSHTKMPSSSFARSSIQFSVLLLLNLEYAVIISMSLLELKYRI